MVLVIFRLFPDFYMENYEQGTVIRSIRNLRQILSKIESLERELDEKEYLHRDDIMKSKGANCSYQPKHADHKFASKINLGMYEHPKLNSQKV